jgi:YebC/PmpR family DNA-binding regulatory protein
MSGHSKWATIKRKKGLADAARGKVFTKIGREIAVAVKEGGPDPDGNLRLQNAIARAKAANMPGDTIARSIKKAAGEGTTNNYEQITYEGYGPEGVAIIVTALTDNRNRTAASMRHIFDKCGGNLGQSGCVQFMFNRNGVIMVEKTDEISEDKIMEDALESGASDFNTYDEFFEIKTEPNDFAKVRDAFEAKGYEIDEAEVTYVPTVTAKIEDPELKKKMERLLEMLDDDDDVQSVAHNWDE